MLKVKVFGRCDLCRRTTRINAPIEGSSPLSWVRFTVGRHKMLCLRSMCRDCITGVARYAKKEAVCPS